MPDKIISTREAAEILGVSDSRIRQLISSDDLQARGTFGRATQLHRRDVEALARLRKKAADKKASR